jgi:hypothetical protein
VADLQSGHLTESGQALFCRQMVSDLARRLQVIEYLKQNPSINEVEIPRIIYITGLERTGTTLLHNLLNLDDRARAFLRWELMFPIPAPEKTSHLTDPRIQQVQKSIDRLRGTKLEHMHWVEAEDPEECYWAMLNGFGVLGGSAGVVMPRFKATICNESIYQALMEYRQIIKILLCKHPLPANGHLILKSPQFSNYLPALRKALPECHIVLTHRDPYRALVSVCNLQAHIHEPFINRESLYRTDGPIYDSFVKAAPGRLANITKFAASDDHVSSVAYPELVNDPRRVVRQIYYESGVAAPVDIDQRVEGFILAQRSGRRAKPAGAFKDFGINPKQLRKDPDVDTYYRHFRVEPEQERLTGA